MCDIHVYQQQGSRNDQKSSKYRRVFGYSTFVEELEMTKANYYGTSAV